MSTTVHNSAKEWACDNEQYHGDFERVSNSTKELFRERRAEYVAVFITRKQPKAPPTKNMILGTFCHIAIWEPELWVNQAPPEPEYPVRPELAPDGKPWLRRKGSDHERWDREFQATVAAMRDEWLASCEGKLVVPSHCIDKVPAIRESVYANDRARSLLEMDAMFEHTITWDCSMTGLPLKSRRDMVNDDFLLDLKVVADNSPQGFAAMALNMGYHRQADFYLRGQEAFTGGRPDFLFLTVNSSPPHEVAVYELDKEFQRMANEENDATLRQLAACCETGDWREQNEVAITTLSPPRWGKYANEYQQES